MERVPLLGADAQLDAAGRAARDQIVASRGAVLRPFAVLLHQPALARRVGELGAELRFAGDLRDDQRELVILATARAHRCAFEWVSHHDLALAAGVRPGAIAALEADAGDETFTDDEMPLVAFARALVRSSAVDDATFARARALLGTSGVVELAALVGYYSMLAHVLNSCAPGAD
ncbi:MAG TPA: carboxymuconolactone decarboxylase family protein [Euzebyales bacterium]|nr:carboxymuconolactone decarboxylase family protein [Euzebyales bacterium]